MRAERLTLGQSGCVGMTDKMKQQRVAQSDTGYGTWLKVTKCVCVLPAAELRDPSPSHSLSLLNKVSEQVLPSLLNASLLCWSCSL